MDIRAISSATSTGMELAAQTHNLRPLAIEFAPLDGKRRFNQMKDLLELRNNKNIITLQRVIFSDLFPQLLICTVALLIDIGIILLIGSASSRGLLYDDGIHGMQSFPIIHIIITLGLAILLNRSLNITTWIAWVIGAFAFSYIHYDAIINGLLFGSMIPQIFGVLLVLLCVRLYESIQARILDAKSITLPAIYTYALIIVAIVALVTIHRQ